MYIADTFVAAKYAKGSGGIDWGDKIINFRVILFASGIFNGFYWEGSQGCLVSRVKDLMDVWVDGGERKVREMS